MKKILVFIVVASSAPAVCLFLIACATKGIGKAFDMFEQFVGDILQ